MPPKKTIKKRAPYKRTYKRKTIGMKQLSTMMKKVALKTTETKFSNLSIAKWELYHNSLKQASINIATSFAVQGDDDDKRIGNEIYLTGIKFRLMLGQKSDRPNVTFKIFVVEFNSSQAGTIENEAHFYHWASQNVLLDAVQSHRFKVHKAITYKGKLSSLEVGETSREVTYPLQFWIPLKRKISFQQDSGTTPSSGMKDNFRIVIAAYDAYGTLSSDNIGYAQGCATVYFKDP